MNKINRITLIFTVSLFAALACCGLGFAAGGSSEQVVISNFANANAFYQQEKFKEAIAEYGKIIAAGFESANIYYNLGNAYFKTGALGKAILNYERARRIAPNDPDLLTNLEYAKSLVVDRAIGESAPRVVQIVNLVSEYFSASGLCHLLFIINILGFVLLAVNLLFLRIKKFIIFIAAVLLIAYIAGFIILAGKISVINGQKEAVITVTDTDCRFGPLENTTVHFKLYEGSKVIVLKTEEDWSKIRRFDGKIGWVKKASYETI